MDKEIKKNPVKTSQRILKTSPYLLLLLWFQTMNLLAEISKRKLLNLKFQLEKQVNKDSKVNAEESTNESGITKKKFQERKLLKGFHS